jgi:D-alanine-D-alanine ligase
VAYNRDFENAEADPENRAREDVESVANHLTARLSARGYEAIPLGVYDDLAETLAEIRHLGPDVVFNLCESISGDSRFEPLLPMLLEKEGIAYTGSPPLSLSMAVHKPKAKEILRARGVPTPDSFATSHADTQHGPERWTELPFPLIVKPAREDASVGIYKESVVRDAAALRARIAHVLSQYRQPALVEQYIEGREVYASLLADSSGEPQVLPLYEIDFSGLPPSHPRIVSFEGKWVETSPEYAGTKPVRCELPEDARARVVATARAAFTALELRDYGRVDMRLGPDGTPYVIDVNPNCDLSHQAGGFARAAQAAGLTYDDLILRILEQALIRKHDADTIPLAIRSRRHRRPDSAGTVSAGGDRLRSRTTGRSG